MQSTWFKTTSSSVEHFGSLSEALDELLSRDLHSRTKSCIFNREYNRPDELEKHLRKWYSPLFGIWKVGGEEPASEEPMMTMNIKTFGTLITTMQ